MHGISSLRILPAEINPSPPKLATANLATPDLASPDLASLDPSSPDLTTSDMSPGSPGDFRNVLHSAIDDMQQLEGQAQTKVDGVLEGSGTDVHSALIAVEKADLSFQLMMQVRNKIVSAYEEISRMQF